MHIKMIIDCGAFKKGERYHLAPKKANTLLTRGVCVRVNDPLKKTDCKKVVLPHKAAHKKPKHHDNTADKP